MRHQGCLLLSVGHSEKDLSPADIPSERDGPSRAQDGACNDTLWALPRVKRYGKGGDDNSRIDNGQCDVVLLIGT